MADLDRVLAELQYAQRYFEYKADMSIGNGKMKLLSWANACRDALELLKARQWVSVKDRLPNIDENVLVYAEGKNDPIHKIIISSMSDKNIFNCLIKTEPFWREPWQFFDTMYEITHWMPLPEPPKQDAEDGNVH